MPALQQPSTAKKLREERHELAKTIRQLADKINAEKRDFTPEEKEAWEKVNKDYNDYTRQIEVAERAELVEGESRLIAPSPGRPDADHRPGDKRTRPTEEHRCLALQAWMRTQCGRKLRKEHREACAILKVDPTARTFTAYTRPHQERLKEFRDFSASTGSAGAYTIPQGFVARLERALLAWGPMWQTSEVLTTDGGNSTPWPTVNDTSNEGAILAENTAVSELDASFGQMALDAYKYTSKLTQVPVELLEDSAFDLAGILGDMMGERLARITNRHFTTGTGSSQPNGIVTASTLGVSAAGATAITADEVFNLLHSVDPAYRPNAAWMMHDGVLLYLRKLKDSQNRYLWQESMRVGIPEQLLGYPVYINQHMQATVATATKTVIFGALGLYKIRQVRGIRMRRLIERYADADQEGFVAFLRADGDLLNAGTNPVKHLLQA